MGRWRRRRPGRDPASDRAPGAHGRAAGGAAGAGQAGGVSREAAMRNDLVLERRDGPVARLTLNDPERANVLSSGMMAALQGALETAAADEAVRVIVLDAAGKVFC